MNGLPLNGVTRTLASSALSLLILGTATSIAQAEVSQSPLSLTVGVPPNMIFTIDDSGSMVRAYAPDNMGGYDERRAKAGVFNPMYYSPSVTYSAPKVVDSLGAEKQLSTTFTKAYVNGFHPSRGDWNLSFNYFATINHNPAGNIGSSFGGYTSTANRLAENPAADFRCTGTGLTAGSPTKTCSIAGGQVTATITRTDSTNCTATISGWNNGECTLNSGNWTASWVRTGVPAYYYTYNAGNTGCTAGDLTDEDCYSVNFVSTDEQQNFANWYSFYRTRALATLSAASLAFFDLSPAVRLTWQGLGNCKTLNGGDATNCKDNKLRAYTTEHKTQFYSWLSSINFNQSTYLPAAMKRAGTFLSGTTAWELNPNGTGNTTANTYACRPSYHVMMTDGEWNENVTNPSSFRHDNATFTLPDGKTYSPAAPYADATSSTLADLAMHYWATDLNTSLNNKLAPFIPFKSGNSTTDYWDPRNDPATWQHMVNFLMGLGLTNSLQRANIQWQGSTFASAANGNGYKSFADGTAWPAASDSAPAGNNVYDLWHAAINSRGEFFSVDSPEAMVQAFTDILSRIAERKSSAAKPAVNSGQLSDEEGEEGTLITVSYQTSYASDENWSGNVKRFEKKWNATTNSFQTSEIWNAESKLPGWSVRNIKIAATSGTSKLQDFTWANAGSATTAGTLAFHLSKDPEIGSVADTKGPQRLEYLRGNRAGEGTTFRQRSAVLGDFYSSSPVAVSTARYLPNFADRLEGTTGVYAAFREEMKSRTPRLYVGSNSGMLHGFNAKTGVEEFAFIPTAVFSKLNKLTGKNYTHDFYVDGSPVVADVYDGSAWRTILVSTLRAGGKSVFALDITTPGSEKLLWEFSESSITGADAVKMGYSFSQPTIARLHTGKWAVVFGNGYESSNSSSGKAALFIVDAIDGSLVKSLEVTGTSGIHNGLSTPKLADYNADGVADYAYAGDLQGNLWRFDLLRDGRNVDTPFITTDDGATAAADFEVGYGGNPLFKAKAANGTTIQPITAPPSLMRHPTGTGYLVIFGTGKFFETADKEGDKSVAQTVYGIWDERTRGEEDSSAPSITRSKLQAQTITSQVTATNSLSQTKDARIISNNAVNWVATATEPAQKGWFLELKNGTLDGEMVVEAMATLGQTLFFQTLVPNTDPCADGATNWTYAINPFTGGKTPHNAFDYKKINADSSTTNISAIRQDGEGGITISQDPGQGFELSTGRETVRIFPDPSSFGRQSWRMVEEK